MNESNEFRVKNLSLLNFFLCLSLFLTLHPEKRERERKFFPHPSTHLEEKHEKESWKDRFANEALLFTFFFISFSTLIHFIFLMKEVGMN